jgi:major membrane immunogen (membrane-anchored lipoprotein)
VNDGGTGDSILTAIVVLVAALLIGATGGYWLNSLTISQGEYRAAVCDYLKGDLEGEVCVKDGKVLFDARKAS